MTNWNLNAFDPEDGSITSMGTPDGSSWQGIEPSSDITALDVLSSTRNYCLFESDCFHGEKWTPLGGNATASESPDWLLEAIKIKHDPSQESLVNLITNIRKLIALRQFDSLKSALTTIPASVVAPEIVVSAFRAAYTAREKIVGWQSLVLQKKHELEERGLDGDQLLRGLTRDNDTLR